MFNNKTKLSIEPNLNHSQDRNSNYERLTALWALSESALGGVLHALRIPFRGIMISGVAVLIISMIANFCYRRGQILKSTIIVIAAKAIISPHTPATAYFSVFIQGLLGELFFITKRFRFILTVMFAVTVSLLNGLQKILVLTLIYGAALWSTLNDFFNYIVEDWLFFNVSHRIDFSFIVISVYVGIHLLAGVVTGVLAYRIPKKINEKLTEPEIIIPVLHIKNDSHRTAERKNKKLIKPFSVMIFLIAVFIVVISYLSPETERFNIPKIIVMIVRSILIMFIWFYFISPLIKKYIRNRLTKTNGKYSKEIEYIVSGIPEIKQIVISVWKYSSEYKGFWRIYQFIIFCLIYILADFNHSGKSQME